MRFLDRLELAAERFGLIEPIEAAARSRQEAIANYCGTEAVVGCSPCVDANVILPSESQQQ